MEKTMSEASGAAFEPPRGGTTLLRSAMSALNPALVFPRMVHPSFPAAMVKKVPNALNVLVRDQCKDLDLTPSGGHKDKREI
jgi:hypothetical protein